MFETPIQEVLASGYAHDCDSQGLYYHQEYILETPCFFALYYLVTFFWHILSTTCL